MAKITLDTLAPRTRAVHSGIRRSQYGELSEAMHLTQGFAYESAEIAEARFAEPGPDEFIYARYGNPTVATFQDRLAAIEGAQACVATASGMAAVNSVFMSQLSAGDHVVAGRALFGSCLHILNNVLPRFGIEVSFVDARDPSAFDAAMQSNTRMVFFESLSNPVLELADIGAISEIAHRHGAMVVVDNVFATPVFSQAVPLGADLVIYSTTKHIDGQGRCLGGAILGPHSIIDETIATYCKHTGPAISPFNAWVMLKGLETLDLRVRAQTESAQFLAESIGELGRVIYPGLPDHPQHALARAQMGPGGTVLALDTGSAEAAYALLNRLQVWTLSNNLGDAKSIICHPATTTHQSVPEPVRAELGITEGMLRLSCGLEDPQDLLADLLGS